MRAYILPRPFVLETRPQDATASGKAVMAHIELSSAEQELLVELLESSYEQLEVEIKRTDSLEYKEGLKQRRLILKSLLAKTREPVQDYF